MGEGEALSEEQPKKSRHRKKHLYNTILQQMEFYFSDSNISKDRFLSQLLYESPYVDLEVFLKFNKIRKLNCSLDDIRKAIKKSEIIELSEDNQTIRRIKPIKIKDNVDMCTVYVENIKSDANHESLTQIFSDFGHVVYVSIPKYKHNKANKGFAFIEYETEQEATDALNFFESIGCKIPAEKNPDELQSILTFEGDDTDSKKNEETEKTKDNLEEMIDEDGDKKINDNLKEDNFKKQKNSTDEEPSETKKLKTGDEESVVKNCKKQKNSTCEEPSETKKLKTDNEESVAENSKKRKNSTHEEPSEAKKLKTDDKESVVEICKKRQISTCEEPSEAKKLKTDDEESVVEDLNQTREESDGKKKKKNKKDKRKNFIRELGMQVLSKKEWKKLRNCYLDLQKKKMKEFKQYLYRQKFSQKSYDKKRPQIEQKESKDKEVNGLGDNVESKKLCYAPGVIVKLKLSEPCYDVKKLKNEIKSVCPEVKYVDIPLPSGSEEVFIRFSSSDAAKDFCTKEFTGEKSVLNDTEEKFYWEKIENDRTVRFDKLAKKQRGREKLLKKAEKETNRHLRFEETE